MDFNKPELKDHYASVLSQLRGWMALLADWLEDATPEHMPVGTKRWSEVNRRFERFDGAVWQPLAKHYRINVDQLDGLDAGNGTGKIPVNNGQINHNLNAEKLGGQATGYYASQADNQTRVAKVGDTMTGPLMLAGDAAQPLEAVTKQQLDKVQQGAIPADGSVTEQKISEGAITQPKIAPRAVSADKLALGAAKGNLGYTPVGTEGDQTINGSMTTCQWLHLLNPANGAMRSLFHNGNAIGFVGQDRQGKFFVVDNGDIWTPMFGWLSEFLNSKANAGAECQHNSGIWEFGSVAIQGNYTAITPSPWLMTGIRSQKDTNSLWLYASKVRNQ